MKIKLIFDEEDRDGAELAIKAQSMLSILRELDAELRSKIKHQDLSEEAERAYRDVRETLRDLIDQENLPLERR